VPEGSAPPLKSAAEAGLLPLPVTVQAALIGVVVALLRVTVKVNGVVPDVASAIDALAAAIDRLGRGGAFDMSGENRSGCDKEMSSVAKHSAGTNDT
jgi:hypothetical protein